MDCSEEGSDAAQQRRVLPNLEILIADMASVEVSEPRMHVGLGRAKPMNPQFPL